MAFPLSPPPQASAVIGALQDLRDGIGSLAAVQSAAAEWAEEAQFGEEGGRELSDAVGDWLSEVAGETATAGETAPSTADPTLLPSTVNEPPPTMTDATLLPPLTRSSTVDDAPSETVPPSPASTFSSSDATPSSATITGPSQPPTLASSAATVTSSALPLETITLSAIPPPLPTSTVSSRTSLSSDSSLPMLGSRTSELSSVGSVSSDSAASSAFSSEKPTRGSRSDSSTALSASSTSLSEVSTVRSAGRSSASTTTAATSSASQTSEAIVASSTLSSMVSSQTTSGSASSPSSTLTSSRSSSSSSSSLSSSAPSSSLNSVALAAADAASSPSSNTASSEKDSSSGLSRAQIGGIAGGIAVAFLLALVLALLFRRRRHSRYSSLKAPDSSFSYRNSPSSAPYAPPSSFYRSFIDEEAPPPEMAQTEQGGTSRTRGGYAGLTTQPMRHDPFADDEEAEVMDDASYRSGRGAMSYGALPTGRVAEEEDDRDLLRAARGYNAPARRPTLDARAVPVAHGHNASLPVVGVIPPSTVGPSSPSSSSSALNSRPRPVSSASADLFDGGANPFERDGDESSEGEQGEVELRENKGTWLGRRKLGGAGSPFFGSRMPST